ncbi:uncharacterized protein AB675_5070 [Cyphellophora attinorum]|uniref:Uncharacterized protein n=1 Tax=Cyphellophora attinorum TaxID=1664694 RepID=A0A0N1HSU9_9EURO|nr:uncharacterized protein AB675_5070 [Phialophora attinorum]KPI39403.1 hypothetical protein AB675_5070 [Phialophora attinorum]
MHFPIPAFLGALLLAASVSAGPFHYSKFDKSIDVQSTSETYTRPSPAVIGFPPANTDFEAGEQVYTAAVKANFNMPRDVEDQSSNDHGKARRKILLDKIIQYVKSGKGSKTNAAMYQDVGGDPGDGTWG